MTYSNSEIARQIETVKGFIGQSTSKEGISLDELMHKCRESNLTKTVVFRVIKALHFNAEIYCPSREHYKLVDPQGRYDRRVRT